MLPSQSISAIVAIVIICYSHLGLNNQNIAHNSSKVVEAVHLENGPIVFHQNIDSIEKSDHNFYLPLEDERIKLSSAENKRDTSKLSSTNTKRSCPSVWKTFTNLQAQSKQQCFFYRRSINKNGTTIKSVTSRNTTSENCERSLDFYKTDDEPKISKENVLNMSTSQMKEVNKSKPASDNIVDDIILNFKSASPVSAIDMLSFDEWRKKISEQMNKATAHNKQQLQQDLNLANEHSVGDNPNNPVATQPNVKIVTNRARNFASYECGAKVVDSNSEADFVNRVLNEQTDEYMLNPCKTKNWFVIELCETIQPQYMELANFELYSSIPKEFSVSASEHYPARNEWSVLGSFISNDVRTVQGFKLHNNGFVKYLRIQLNSYYGSEHFCPY
ncbi:hypothetical protein BLOT_009553 [Blomia tropicalis]|nr:hypothetical protein BLOT_009553 [Blomia tropicalis]